MAFRVYVGTAFVQKDDASFWMNKLRGKDVVITHDWTVVETPAQQGLPSELGAPIEQQMQWALEDIRGVESADLVWILAGGTGCWWEAGAAYAYGRRLFVSGNRRTIFSSLVDYCDTHQEAFDAIVELSKLQLHRSPGSPGGRPARGRPAGEASGSDPVSVSGPDPARTSAR